MNELQTKKILSQHHMEELILLADLCLFSICMFPISQISEMRKKKSSNSKFGTIKLKNPLRLVMRNLFAMYLDVPTLRNHA